MSLETWNTFDNLPNIMAGQKVIVWHQRGPLSDLLADLAIEKYGKNNVIIFSAVAWDYWLKWRDQETYERLLHNTTCEVSKFNTQTIIFTKQNIPSPLKSAATQNWFDVLFKNGISALGLTNEPHRLITDYVFLEPHTKQWRDKININWEAAEKGTTPALLLQRDPSHQMHKQLKDGEMYTVLPDTGPIDETFEASVEIFRMPDWVYTLSDKFNPNDIMSVIGNGTFLHQPFGELSIEGVLELAFKLNKHSVITNAWSCQQYHPNTTNPTHCGTCNRCTAYREILKRLGQEDVINFKS